MVDYWFQIWQCLEHCQESGKIWIGIGGINRKFVVIRQTLLKFVSNRFIIEIDGLNYLKFDDSSNDDNMYIKNK